MTSLSRENVRLFYWFNDKFVQSLRLTKLSSSKVYKDTTSQIKPQFITLMGALRINPPASTTTCFAGVVAAMLLPNVHHVTKIEREYQYLLIFNKCDYTNCCKLGTCFSNVLYIKNDIDFGIEKKSLRHGSHDQWWWSTLRTKPRSKHRFSSISGTHRGLWPVLHTFWTFYCIVFVTANHRCPFIKQNRIACQLVAYDYNMSSFAAETGTSPRYLTARECVICFLCLRLM